MQSSKLLSGLYELLLDIVFVGLSLLVSRQVETH